MVIKIERTVYEDTFELTRTDGTTVQVPFLVNIAETNNKVAAVRRELNGITDLESLGKGYVQLLQAIFGDQVLSRILEFYDTGERRDYLSMAIQLTPVIINNIFPLYDKFRKDYLAFKKATKITKTK